MNNRILNFLKGMAKDSSGEFPELTESEIANLGEGLVADYEASLKEPYALISNGKETLKNAICKDSSASDCIALNVSPCSQLSGLSDHFHIHPEQDFH